MVLALTAAAASLQASAKVQQAPSSRVALDLPDGYTPSSQFSGFVNEAAGTSIVVLEMPGAAYEQVARGMTAEALAAKGVGNARAATLARPEPYLYMQAEQTAPTGAYAKFLMIFRQADVTALVTANVEKGAIERGAVKAEDIEAILRSATIAPSAAPSREVFKLDYLGPFKAAGSILGTTHVYTLDGRLEPAHKGEKRAMVIVAPSLDRRPVIEPQGYAEQLLGGLPGLERSAIAERKEVRIAGLATIELVGTARDKDGGGEVALYQALLLPEGGGYYRIVGQMPVADRERLLPEVRRIAAGFRPTAP